MDALVALLVGYVVGSAVFGVIVPRLMGIDIYEHGSGNPGASNVFRTIGKGPAALVLLGDAAKGVVAVLVGAVLGGEVVAAAAGLAAVVGHILPVWHRFRGGRGVATAIGVAIALHPVAGLVLAVVWLVLVLVGKVASIASLVTMALYVPALAIGGIRGAALGLTAVIVVLVVVRHAPNIRRILSGSERRVGG